jgi:hypothetical protein
LIRPALQLLAMRGCFAWRSNSGAARLPGRGGKLQLVRFGTPGVSDLLAVAPGGKLIAVELKAGKNPQTKAQAAFAEQVVARGGIYLLVRDLAQLNEELDRLLKEAR